MSCDCGNKSSGESAKKMYSKIIQDNCQYILRARVPVTISVPLIFHVMDQPDSDLLRSKITNMIIFINKIFNITQQTLNNILYNAKINNIFKSYQKKQYLYIYQFYRLMADNKIIKWEFVLKDIVFSSNCGKSFTDDVCLNNKIKANSPAIDPELNVNIWINTVENSFCLDKKYIMADFPWENRDYCDIDQFDSTKRDFHGIILDSKILDLEDYIDAVHALGHYFGLLHTFDNTCDNEIPLEYDPLTNQDVKGDLIVDTPNQIGPTLVDVDQINQNYDAHLMEIFDDDNSYQPMFMNVMDVTPTGRTYFTFDQHYKMVFFIECFFPSLIISMTYHKKTY